MENYQKAWDEWKSSPENYFSNLAENLHWYKKWDKVWDMDGLNNIKWYVGGQINLCYNCLDRNIADGFGNKTAVIYESHYTKEVKLLTYSQLHVQVSKLAGFLQQSGVEAGDYVLINLPMIPETMIALLAAVRIGAPYLVVTPGHMHILRESIEELKPKVIFSTNCAYQEKEIVLMKTILDDVLGKTKHKPLKCIIFQRPISDPAKTIFDRDVLWDDAINKGHPCDCVSVEATKPLFLIYTSGSTGKPKGIIHAVGSLSVGLLNDGVKTWHCCDGGVYWALTQFAWIGGHCAITFGPLLTRTATILYEGPAFDPVIEDIYRILVSYGVTNVFFTIPLIKSLINKDSTGELARQFGNFKLKNIVSGGAAADEKTVDYVKKVFNAPLLQLYGQTEFAGPITTYELNNGHLVKDRPQLSSGKPFPGWQMKILKDDGTEACAGKTGSIVFKLPMGPGVFSGFFNNEKLFHDMYLKQFPGYYETKDEGFIDKNGYLFVTNRTDSVFKLKGDRFSCDQIEQVILSHEDVSECLVVLLTVSQKNNNDEYTVPVGFYAPYNNSRHSVEEINGSLSRRLLEEFGNRILVVELLYVKSIPKTAAGKLSRSMIQTIMLDAIHLKEKPDSKGIGILSIWEAFRNSKTYKKSMITE